MPKIALVDDDQNILASLSMALKSEGFDVERFADGRAALEALSQNQQILVFLTLKCLAWTGWNYCAVCAGRLICPLLFS